jgi:hypothetical protein
VKGTKRHTVTHAPLCTTPPHFGLPSFGSEHDPRDRLLGRNSKLSPSFDNHTPQSFYQPVARSY